jgi:hypothetical protein
VKTNDELRAAALRCAVEIVTELSQGGGVTHASLIKLETNSRIAHATITTLKNRAVGNPDPKQG